MGTNYKIKRVNVKSEIIKKGNKIFAASFRKKDNTLRKMNARLGVRKGTSGGQNKVEANDRSYLTVYDMNNDAFRTINLDTLEEIRICGTSYEVI